MIKFTKMHGNGNDFVMVNSLEQEFKPTKSLISKLGDRNLGIGFDQMIHIGVPTKDNKDFYIKFSLDSADSSIAKDAGLAKARAGGVCRTCVPVAGQANIQRSG